MKESLGFQVEIARSELTLQLSRLCEQRVDSVASLLLRIKTHPQQRNVNGLLSRVPLGLNLN